MIKAKRSREKLVQQKREDTSKSDFVVDVYVQDETILPESDEFLKSTLYVPEDA